MKDVSDVLNSGVFVHADHTLVCSWQLTYALDVEQRPLPLRVIYIDTFVVAAFHGKALVNRSHVASASHFQLSAVDPPSCIRLQLVPNCIFHPMLHDPHRGKVNMIMSLGPLFSWWRRIRMSVTNKSHPCVPSTMLPSSGLILRHPCHFPHHRLPRRMLRLTVAHPLPASALMICHPRLALWNRRSARCQCLSLIRTSTIYNHRTCLRQIKSPM